MQNLNVPTLSSDVLETDTLKINECLTVGVKIVDINFKSITIFDWDDTLLASSCLNAHGYSLTDNGHDTPEAKKLLEEMKQLEEVVYQILTLALNSGEVHIITNAENGWVQRSAQRFLPKVVPLIEKTIVVSARSTYEEHHPNAPIKWKVCAFVDKFLDVFPTDETRKNVLSLGDSLAERHAVHTASKLLKNVCTKSVKFVEMPTVVQLKMQLEFVLKCWNYIHNHSEDLDLMLTISIIPLIANTTMKIEEDETFKVYEPSEKFQPTPDTDTLKMQVADPQNTPSDQEILA